MTSDIGDTARQVAEKLRGERFSTGDLAEFRRWRQSEPIAPVFYRFIAAEVPPDLRSVIGERRWATYIHFAAMLAVTGQKEPLSIGRALAETGYHDRRMIRLLADTDFAAALEAVVRWLVNNRQPVRMTELFFAVWTNGSEHARETIARDFYYTVSTETK